LFRAVVRARILFVARACLWEAPRVDQNEWKSNSRRVMSKAWLRGGTARASLPYIERLGRGRWTPLPHRHRRRWLAPWPKASLRRCRSSAMAPGRSTLSSTACAGGLPSDGRTPADCVQRGPARRTRTPARGNPGAPHRPPHRRRQGAALADLMRQGAAWAVPPVSEKLLASAL